MKLPALFLKLSIVVSILLTTHSCTKDEKTTIAVVPKGTSHVFWKSVHAGAKKAEQELGIETIWQGPEKEDDRQMQIQVVQNFISRNVDALVLAPLDEVALIRPVEAAIKRNIPTVIIDSDLKTDNYVSFVATDNFEGGKIAAKELARLLKGNGNILMMRYAEGSASTAKREEGFLEGINEYAPDVTLLSTDQYAGVTAESALQTGQNLINKYEELDGIFCPNESTTFGMLRALQTAAKAGTIKFVGFDSSEPLVTALEKEEIHGLVVQNPFKMGYLGVKTAMKALKGKPVEKRIDTGAMLVTKDNLDTPPVQQAISPELDKWLSAK
ncbi:MAG: substrate-binding domain-containing protein [Chitinivibrionales bacterium]|nr:substrate-binding domain-containing protein [Chitinivibrionales bacterium]